MVAGDNALSPCSDLQAWSYAYAMWLLTYVIVPHLSFSVERDHGLTRDHSHTRPADVLINGWDRGKPAALDITVTSPLCPGHLGRVM